MNNIEAMASMAEGKTVVLTSGHLAGTKLRAVITVTYEAHFIDDTKFREVPAIMLESSSASTFEVTE